MHASTLGYAVQIRQKYPGQTSHPNLCGAIEKLLWDNLIHVYNQFYFIDNACGFRLKGYPCRSGETGRRTGLKIPRGQLHVGSIPTSGTNEIKGLAIWVNPFFGAEIVDCA